MIERFHLGKRSYLTVQPVVAPPWPVVVMLHGAGGTASWTLQETRWADHAQREGILLVVPEATRADPSSSPGFLTNPQVWNDGASDGQPPRPDVDDVAFLSDVLDDVARRFEIVDSRILMTGFSNGAAMVFRFAAERADRLAAIAPIAGYCHVEPRPCRAVPTLYVVGAVDPLVPLQGGDIVTPWGRSRVHRVAIRDALRKWAKAIDCDPNSRIIESQNGLTMESFPGPVPFLFYRIDDHGHHWPGGRGELLRRIAGPAAPHLDANKLICDFFHSVKW